jgi:hypothetical protein
MEGECHEKVSIMSLSLRAEANEKEDQGIEAMPSKMPSSFIPWTLFSIAFATQAASQQTPTLPKPHTRYKLVDLGTFGGPISKIPFAQRDLTKAGAVVGSAETSIPDPFSPNCASPSCRVQHGFTWRDGVIAELLGLDPNLESGAQAINEAGIVVGESQNGLIDSATGTPIIHAVLWKKGRLLDLGTRRQFQWSPFN